MKTARAFVWAIFVAALAVVLTAAAQQMSNAQQKSDAPKSDASKSEDSKSGGKIAPYYPTPERIVDKMLQLGGLKAGEKVWDLGSGDGRIVIMAAQKFHADAVGIELDKDLCKL